jgi:hypothetical protein
MPRAGLSQRRKPRPPAPPLAVPVVTVWPVVAVTLAHAAVPAGADGAAAYGNRGQVGFGVDRVVVAVSIRGDF